MSRRLILLLAVAVALFTLAPAVGASHRTDHRNATFTAHLTGAEENPPVVTDATGQAIFKVRGDADNRTLSFKLIVANIDNVTMAHIHCGAVGVDGGVAVTLYAGPTTSDSGILSQAVITDDDVGGCLGAEATVDDLLELIEMDQAYVNVHTDDGEDPPDTGPGDFPGGEIRGQIG